MEHGGSPGASRGVWAEGSVTVPRPLIVLGEPPCTEMALSSGDCKDGKPVEDPPAVGSKVPGIGT